MWTASSSDALGGLGANRSSNALPFCSDVVLNHTLPVRHHDVAQPDVLCGSFKCGTPPAIPHMMMWSSPTMPCRGQHIVRIDGAAVGRGHAVDVLRLLLFAVQQDCDQTGQVPSAVDINRGLLVLSVGTPSVYASIVCTTRPRLS
jgi:hypothetical protein